MELWRTRPGDVIVLPVFPGEVTVTGAGLGSRYHATRIEWERADGMSGTLDLGDFTEVRLLASEDGANAAWLNPPVPECRVHGPVGDDHFPCRVPGESAELFNRAVPRTSQGHVMDRGREGDTMIVRDPTSAVMVSAVSRKMRPASDAQNTWDACILEECPPSRTAAANLFCLCHSTHGQVIGGRGYLGSLRAPAGHPRREFAGTMLEEGVGRG